jgi:hypothetical protein
MSVGPAPDLDNQLLELSDPLLEHSDPRIGRPGDRADFTSKRDE